MDLGQFERSAAEVTDNAVGLVETGYHPERGQFRLALAGEDVDLAAADVLGLGDEGLAVLGVPAGRRGDRPELRNLHAVAQGAKAPQRAERLLDRVGGEQPGGLHLASEPRQDLLVEDRGRAAGEALVDHEAHRVRADVDDGDRRPVIETALRGVHR